MADSPTMMETMLEHWELAKSLRQMAIYYVPEKCTGVFQCIEVCPIGCWSRDEDARQAVFQHGELCIACGACVLQCPEDAISLR